MTNPPDEYNAIRKRMGELGFPDLNLELANRAIAAVVIERALDRLTGALTALRKEYHDSGNGA